MCVKFHREENIYFTGTINRIISCNWLLIQSNYFISVKIRTDILDVSQCSTTGYSINKFTKSKQYFPS